MCSIQDRCSALRGPEELDEMSLDHHTVPELGLHLFEDRVEDQEYGPTDMTFRSTKDTILGKHNCLQNGAILGKDLMNHVDIDGIEHIGNSNKKDGTSCTATGIRGTRL